MPCWPTDPRRAVPLRKFLFERLKPSHVNEFIPRYSFFASWFFILRILIWHRLTMADFTLTVDPRSFCPLLYNSAGPWTPGHQAGQRRGSHLSWDLKPPLLRLHSKKFISVNHDVAIWSAYYMLILNFWEETWQKLHTTEWRLEMSNEGDIFLPAIFMEVIVSCSCCCHPQPQHSTAPYLLCSHDPDNSTPPTCPSLPPNNTNTKPSYVLRHTQLIHLWEGMWC